MANKTWSYNLRTAHGRVRGFLRHSTADHARHYNLPDVIVHQCPECGRFIPEAFRMLEFGLPGEIYSTQRYYCSSCGWADSIPDEHRVQLGFAVGLDVKIRPL